jgi:broad specificity phosphatase PhoE
LLKFRCCFCESDSHSPYEFTGFKVHQVDRILVGTEVKSLDPANIGAEIAGISNLPQDHDLREHDRDNIPIIGSESVSKVRIGFVQAISRLLENSAKQSVAVVSHGTLIAAFVAEHLKSDPIPVWSSVGLPGFLEIEWPFHRKLSTRRDFNKAKFKYEDLKNSTFWSNTRNANIPVVRIK